MGKPDRRKATAATAPQWFERPVAVFAGGALIVLTTFFVYFPALNGDFLLDDDILLTRSAFIKAPDGLYRFWFTTGPIEYYPLSNSMLWLEWRLWGMAPTGYHVTSVLLHLASVMLLWATLRTLSVPGAFLAAFLFAVHPVNVESVAWIAQRKGMLALFFGVLSAFFYAKLETSASSSAQQTNVAGNRCYWLSLLAGVLAMLSKASVVILPLVLLGVVAWRRRLNWRDFARVTPLAVAGVALAALNLWFKLREVGYREVSLVERLLGAAGTVWFYLWKALLPFDLAFIYPQWRIDVGEPRWWLPLLVAVAVTALLWIYRHGWSRPLLFAWLYFGVCLIPVMGFNDVGYMRQSLVADHYQHAALIGVVGLVAAAIGRWQMRARISALPLAVAVVVSITLTWLSWQQAKLFAGPLTLYPAAIAKNPDQWMAYTNLGNTLSDLGRWPEAIDQFEQALRVDPKHAGAHANLGRALAHTGKITEGIEHYREAVRLSPHRLEIRVNFGAVLTQAGLSDEALAQYDEALRIAPQYPEAIYQRATLLTRIGRASEAIAGFQYAAQRWPDRPEVQQNLGIALVKTNRLAEAIAAFQQAIRLNPDRVDTHFNLALVLAASGRVAEAIDHYQTVLRLKPDYAAARKNLETLLAKK